MIKVTVNKEKTIYADYGANLFELLTDNGFSFPGSCGGAGRCSRCTVYIGNKPYKSCHYIVTTDIEIETAATIDMDILKGRSGDESQLHDIGEQAYDTGEHDSYGVAVDIGTTTIAMELISVSEDGSYRSLSSYGVMNPQIRYGSDVIARIKYAGESSGLKEMSELLYEALRAGIIRMCDEQSLSYKDIGRIALFGNTAMLSIAAGVTTENLGAYPFDLKDEIWLKDFRADVIADELEADIYIPPAVSAFAGADIAGGALVLALDKRAGYNMLIDLGTNGEIILSGGEAPLCLSTACGPAFEEAFKKQGVFGSNICDMIASLIKNHQIDRSGVITERFFDNGINMGQGIIIDMDTVRSFQLAKAAIAAGIEIACKKAGIAYEDIEHVYIAGGFGFYLNPESAMYLGMFPKEFARKYVTVGNTSLKAAVKALCDRDFDGRMKKFTKTAISVNLANEPEFNETYIRHIDF